MAVHFKGLPLEMVREGLIDLFTARDQGIGDKKIKDRISPGDIKKRVIDILKAAGFSVPE